MRAFTFLIRSPDNSARQPIKDAIILPIAGCLLFRELRAPSFSSPSEPFRDIPFSSSAIYCLILMNSSEPRYISRRSSLLLLSFPRDTRCAGEKLIWLYKALISRTKGRQLISANSFPYCSLVQICHLYLSKGQRSLIGFARVYADHVHSSCLSSTCPRNRAFFSPFFF